MTEYDYSPEAFDAYIRKQQQIARWVDKTNATSWRDADTPATPATNLGRTLDDDRTHRRRTTPATTITPDRRDRPREREHRDRERDRDREREVRDRERSRPRDRERSVDKPDRHSTKSHTKRHRSASHSGPTNTRPEPQRSYTVPPPLPLPPFTTQPYTQNGHYPHAPKLANARDSRHSSRSSSTTRIPQVPSPTSYFPAQQQPPYSAPVYVGGRMGPQVRSQTIPVYPSYPYEAPYDAKYPPSSSASSPYFQGGIQTGYPNVSPPQKHLDWATVPQYPHSMYQTKPPPLLKRIFMSLTGGNKQTSSRKGPRRKRSTSF